MNIKDKDKTEYNSLCLKCKKKCKQLKTLELLTCPNFQQKEEQLEIKFTGYSRKKK
jgi:hypothetical protein